MDELAAAPERIGAIAREVGDAALHASPAPGEWSARDVLAHLVACAEVWGAAIERMVAEDEPVIRAVSPRRVHPDGTFAELLERFAALRAALIATLEWDSWERGATVTGAGAPARKTVRSYVERLARHERAHVGQLERAARG